MRQARAQAQAQAQSLAAGESLTNSISSLAQAQKAGAEASLATQQLDPVTNIAGTI